MPLLGEFTKCSHFENLSLHMLSNGGKELSTKIFKYLQNVHISKFISSPLVPIETALHKQKIQIFLIYLANDDPNVA